MPIRSMKRRAFIAGLGGAAAWPLVARGQQPATPIVGILGSASATTYRERLTLILQGLAEDGFKEGRNVALEYRWAEGHLDRLPALAADLVGRKVNVIVATGGLQASRAAISATSTIPIVFSTDGDPVKQGLVQSLSRPGGNATGITVFSASLTAKRLDIFRELVPQAKVFGVLVNASASQASDQIQEAEETGHSLGIEIRALSVRSDADFETVLAAFARVANAALLISADPLFIARRETLIAVVNRHAVPAIYGRRDFTASGGLVSYGADLVEPYRLMGTYVGRILQGAKPADLPVEQPSRFQFVINLKTAKALGLEIPPQLLARADEVIE